METNVFNTERDNEVGRFEAIVKSGAVYTSEFAYKSTGQVAERYAYRVQPVEDVIGDYCADQDKFRWVGPALAKACAQRKTLELANRNSVNANGLSNPTVSEDERVLVVATRSNTSKPFYTIYKLRSNGLSADVYDSIFGDVPQTGDSKSDGLPF